MIDEWYDRTYLDCRAEMNAVVIRLFGRAVRKFRSNPTGETPCASTSSPPSQSR